MMDRPRALAVLIAVFFLGTVLGSAGSYFWFKKTAHPQSASPRNGHPPRPPDHPRLQDELGLTQEQNKRFEEIMEAMRSQLETLSAEQAPKIDSIRSETNRKLSATLNEEQKKKFEELQRRWEKERRRPPRNRNFERPR